MLGCYLVSSHFLWAIHPIRPVYVQVLLRGNFFFDVHRKCPRPGAPLCIVLSSWFKKLRSQSQITKKSLISSFIKERGQIEADYAKNLRRLVKRYQPKDAPRPTEEEFSHIRGYKQVRAKAGPLLIIIPRVFFASLSGKFTKWP